VISFELQVTLYETKGGGGPRLSLLYAGLGLGFLISGAVVRWTGACTLVVVVSTAYASVCYTHACIFRDWYVRSPSKALTRLIRS
jgi:hypothetical protein